MFEVGLLESLKGICYNRFLYLRLLQICTVVTCLLATSTPSGPLLPPTQVAHTTLTSDDSTMYASVLRKLYSINNINPVKMGLENSQRLYALLGR
jgi:hypothetical protein